MAELWVGQFPVWVWLLLAPVVLGLAAWALQLATAFVGVDPPDFWQCLTCVIVVGLTNLVLRVWVDISVSSPGLEFQVLAPLVLTVSIIAVFMRTGPVAALLITFCDGLLTAGLFVGLSEIGTTLKEVL